VNTTITETRPVECSGAQCHASLAVNLTNPVSWVMHVFAVVGLPRTGPPIHAYIHRPQREAVMRQGRARMRNPAPSWVFR
jgi:hypothetical protein